MELLDPWGHQQSAADWLDDRLFGFLAHEMGCGKTRSVLIALKNKRLVLVVCPIAVGAAWAKQVSLFDAGRQAVVVVEGSAKVRAAKIREAANAGKPVVVVINYDAVWRGDVAKAVESVQWDAIVLDESHRIKSPTGKATKWLSKLAVKQPTAKRICLSGTPTPNNPLDWWGQFLFLCPEVLGKSFTAFRARIANVHPRYPGWVTGFREADLAALKNRIDPHIHRVKAEEVLTLPDTIHEHIPVTLGKRTEKFYRDLEEEMIAKFDNGDVVTAANPMVVVNRLHLAASGFARVDGSDVFTAIDGVSDKRLALREFLEDFPKHEPLVVFVKFIEDLKEVAAECRQSGRSVSVLCGATKQLEEWQQGETDVIVVQQQAGGSGVDLVRACYCVYYSLSHSLGDYQQSLARLHRPGQTKCCRYYHIVATGTVDETIYEALREKRDVVESILSNLTRRAFA